MQSQLFAASRLQAESCVPRGPSVGKVSECGQLNAARVGAARSMPIAKRKSLAVTAQAMGKADPPDVPKSRDGPQGGREWLQSILSRFGPVREKASNTTVLDFEKPLVELDNRIKEVSHLTTLWVTSLSNVLVHQGCSRLFQQSGHMLAFALIAHMLAYWSHLR